MSKQRRHLMLARQSNSTQIAQGTPLWQGVAAAGASMLVQITPVPKMRHSAEKRASFGQIKVTRLPGAKSLGRLLAGGLRLTCALGRQGVSHRKREGDSATPAGRFRLQRVLYRADRGPRPQTLLPRGRLRRGEGWCDDPGSGRYNCPVRLPFRGGHEAMWRDDRLYDVVIVLDHNVRPCRRGYGSAVFLHIAQPDLAPTAGCVAVSAVDMRRLLPRLSARTVLMIG